MPRLLRLAAALLVLTPLAQSQTLEIIEDADAGVLEDIVSDGEIIDDLNDDEFAADRPSRERPILQRLQGSARQPQVRYRVRGEHSGDATSMLVRLAETDALRSLSTTSTSDSATAIDATFAFETVSDWAAWTERSQTRALLDALAGGLRTDLDVTR